MAGLFIPKKLRVGFRKRSDTFTGQLAYVIYYDEKGQLRKTKSHESWCDPTLGFLELDNEPRSGFVLNKGVERNGYWGSGRSVIRVHDDRGFEIEITVDNLMGLLMHSDVSKRDIVEQCVYAWAGTELVLLPCNSQEYLQAQAFTLAQEVQLSAKDLRLGALYRSKKDQGTGPYGSLVYLGHMAWGGPEKKHVFWEKGWDRASAVGVSTLREDAEETDPNYADYLERALRAQKTEVQTLTPKLLVLGGEYEELVHDHKGKRINRWVYLGQFLWAKEREASGRTVCSSMSAISELKKRSVFFNLVDGRFDSVKCQDLTVNLKPNVVPGWEQLVELAKKTRFTSVPTGRMLQPCTVEDAVASGFFWTVAEQKTSDSKMGTLHAIKRVSAGLEVLALGSLYVTESNFRDGGLYRTRPGISQVMSMEEVAQMQPMTLMLMQENGVGIKREDYNVQVRRVKDTSDFELVHEQG